MRHGMILLCLVVGLAGCHSENNVVEKVMEDGVEVVNNGAEPYRIEGEKQPIGMEEEWIIDLENEDIYDAGLYAIDTFAVDSEGNIYVISLKPEGHHVFKFTPAGDFEISFGQHGQGPGELAAPIAMVENDEGELVVTDRDNAKLIFFDKQGGLIREKALHRNVPFAHPLPNGNYVVFGRISPDPEAATLNFPLELCDEELDPLVLLDTFSIENFRQTRRLRGTMPGLGLAVGAGEIFIGNEARDFEIWVFNDEGALTRKIRKTYFPVPVDESLKKKILARYNENVRPMIYFPETLPPFRSMAADEKGWLFVSTFEKGRLPDQYLIDVFDPSGVLVGILSASVLVDPDSPINTIARNGRFFHMRETESGFKQLVVQKVIFQ